LKQRVRVEWTAEKPILEQVVFTANS